MDHKIHIKSEPGTSNVTVMRQSQEKVGQNLKEVMDHKIHIKSEPETSNAAGRRRPRDKVNYQLSYSDCDSIKSERSSSCQGSDWEPEKPKKSKKPRSRKRKSDGAEAEPMVKKTKNASNPQRRNYKRKSMGKQTKTKKPASAAMKKKTERKDLVDDDDVILLHKTERASSAVTQKGPFLYESQDPAVHDNGVILDKVKSEIPKDQKYSANQEPGSSYGNNNRFSGAGEVPKRLWQDEDVIYEATGVPKVIVKNVINLLDKDCTVPFIARYRKEMSGYLPPEKIREIELSYESVKAVQKRVDSIMKTLNKSVVDPKITHALLNAKTVEEVEYLYAPLKPGSKRSLAERAKKLGLEPYALDLIEGHKGIKGIDFASLVDSEIPGKSNEEEVRKGIQHIIADIVAKDSAVLDIIRNHPAKPSIHFSCKESAIAIKQEKIAFIEGKENQNYKFENYFNFSCPIRNIDSHQILAMNRGENQKVLTIKLEVPPKMKYDIKQKCWQRVVRYRDLDGETSSYFNSCISDAYERLLEPHLCRQIRSELTKKAAKQSIDVFSQNLKRLLLMPPVRGKTVLGIDPGFKHGCKLAVVSSKGDVLKTDVIYLSKPGFPKNYESQNKLVNLVNNYAVSIIAIGNGTACRETESWLSDLIKYKAFQPNEVKYCIVDESGASIYSVTKEAEAELPGMDPNLRSAVAIARRLQDPLLEYVKVEPKHLGVGMYQHDIPENMLKAALNGVVVECVSFVGVDLNVCSEQLLQKIAGLSSARAKQIIQWREAHGCFVNRQQLLEVKGLGPKSYEQCAGFVKILPQTSVNPSDLVVPAEKKKKKTKKLEVDHTPNLLDTTVIHPESYDIAKKFLIELKADVSEIGQQSLVDKVKNYMKFTRAEGVAANIGASVEQMLLIVDAFKQLMDYDIRSEFEVPLFKTGVIALTDLTVNQELTGRVTNVTDFGAFVDIGVGRAGLIHKSKMRFQRVQLGDRVTVRVLSVDIPKKRIGLELVLK